MQVTVNVVYKEACSIDLLDCVHPRCSHDFEDAVQDGLGGYVAVVLDSDMGGSA
jgi:hypothetical protein